MLAANYHTSSSMGNYLWWQFLINASRCKDPSEYFSRI